MLKTLEKVLYPTKTKEDKTFFEYSSREKKKIIKEAARDAIRMQNDLEKKYDKEYSTPRLCPSK